MDSLLIIIINIIYLFPRVNKNYSILVSMNTKPTVIISRCIEFAPCRWNGQMIGSGEIRGMKPFLDLRPICPEEEVGLGTPRKPVRVIRGDDGNRLVQSETGRDVTEDMHRFSEGFLAGLVGVDGFILKAASPSCGPGDVKLYRGTGKEQPVSTRADGLFAEAVLKHFPHTALETEGRLTNFLIREHFLTRVFTSAAFRAVETSGSMNMLVRFHSRNKYLFMAYNQSALREAGKITANHDRLPFSEVIARYHSVLDRMFNRISRTASNINVLMHTLGYFSKNLDSREKAFFLDMLEEYRAGRVPLSACASIMKSWIIRFGSEYLEEQTFFEPFPAGLANLSDSGRGRPIASG